MNNIINNWSYEKPTEPGDYLICYGDVETKENTDSVSIHYCTDNECLVDCSSLCITGDYANGHKFARLVYSPVEIKELEE